MYDVCIIGCGVIGGNIARELSKYKNLKILALDAESDVSQGSSKANSGIVHGGYDAPYNSLKATLGREGNRMFRKLSEELHFPYEEIGSFVLAFTPEEHKKLLELYENGIKIGVNDLRILSGKEAKEMEPHLSVGVYSALYCPSAGICSPYEFTIALFENAIQNGVTVLLNRKVISIESVFDGGGERKKILISNGEVYYSKIIINCAGLFSDQLAEISGAFVDPAGGAPFKIQPRKGEYVLLSKVQGKMAKRVIFQCPTKRWGKGVLVTPTVSGNLLIGPSANDQLSKEDKSTSEQELSYICWAARRSIPHLDTREAITSFAGIRSKGNRNDFIIEESLYRPGFINCAAIDSPGLTASPAIARYVIDTILRKKIHHLELRKDFNPIRLPYVNNNNKEETNQFICKCEMVREQEIREATKRGIHITNTDSIKWRTRAGMGPCQGLRCKKQVSNILGMKESTTKNHRLPRNILAKL